MLKHRASGPVLALILAMACAPPPYEPKAGEEFVSLASIERWSRANSQVLPTDPPRQAHSIAALVTWHLGQDAPLPRAWWQGDCLITDGTWADTEFSPPSHGALTFHGAQGGDRAMEYHRLEAGFDAGEEGWSEGAELSMDAEGGSLPAFQAGSAVPPALTLTTWDLQALEPNELTLSRAQPLELRWAPGTGEAFFLMLQTSDNTDYYFHTAWCHFPAETGTWTVPVEVLQTLEAQADIEFSNIYFGGVVRASQRVDSTEVEWWNWNALAARVQWE